MSIKKEFTCTDCKKEFDEICSYTTYNAEFLYSSAKALEAKKKLEDKPFCEGCIQKRDEQLEKLANK